MRYTKPFLLLFLSGCAGSISQRKTNQPHPVDKVVSSPPKGFLKESGSSLLIGWYCPELAGGAAGLWPLVAKDPLWTVEKPILEKAIASRRVKQFSVLGWFGKRAGFMTVAGAAQKAGQTMAMGAFQGASVCLAEAGDGNDDAECVQWSHRCGLAIGELEASGGFQSRPYEEDPEPLLLQVAKACEQGEVLQLDTDGDGSVELFSIAGLMASGEAPVELPLVLDKKPDDCTMSFASPVRDSAGLVRVAVLDVDGDGRMEVLYRRGKKEFLLYGAPNSPARLELLVQMSTP